MCYGTRAYDDRVSTVRASRDEHREQAETVLRELDEFRAGETVLASEMTVPDRLRLAELHLQLARA